MTDERTPAELIRHHLDDVHATTLVHLAIGPTTILTISGAELRSAIAPPSGVVLPPIFLMYAFRYCLGRMTYAVGDAADALIGHRDQLQAGWREQIVRDIDDAIARGQAGMSGDVARWELVKKAMQP